ncbi:MAG: histidinol dehydrogenase [Acidobacteria bacterium]|nr:histidinol dehydrogenase [Acidobacteriota bacterium]
MKVISPTNVRARRRLLERGQAADPAVAEQAARIVDDVRTRGDRALREYARRFDKLRGSLEVTEQEIRDNAAEAPSAVRRAIAQAARHIRRIAKRQVPREWRAATVPGVVVEQRVTPLARVGCYVPGGRYPLPSSLLMTAVPARVAGVNEVIAVCPRPDPSVCAAALEAGIARLFRIGGAHAVAALAYGTRTVPHVDKIVGPGNAYVAAAKAHVAADCPIDFFAGPTEIVIVAADGNASWIAADLVAQAEHDPDARALLLTPNAELARAVARAVDSQLEHHPAARQSIEQHGGAVVTNDLGEAVDLANAIAPEHAVCDDEFTARALTRAGTVFVGPYGAQAAGDYATGSNHVLPTGGAARFRGGLSAADFVRVSSVQHLSGDGLRRLAPTAISLANAEGLVAHAASIAVRLR